MIAQILVALSLAATAGCLFAGFRVSGVSGGAMAVEKVHKAIANTTFGLIDMFSSDEEFRNSTRKVQQTHHEKTEQVYKAVRTTNRALHILADTLIIGKAEKRIVSKTKKAP